MGAGASAVATVKGKDADAILAGVKDLSPADKNLLMASLEAYERGGCIATNLKDIAANEAQLHELHLAVMTNKQGVYEARSMIEENRASAMQNYAAAFMGNRMMANENSDAIFKNRTAILDAMKTNGPVQANFRNSKYNESMIEYLENRSLLNNRVAKVNDKMSEANADLIAINDMVLKANEEIVTFNAQQIGTNSLLLEGIQADKATPEANSQRIASNKEKIFKVEAKNATYNDVMIDKHVAIKENRKSIEANALQIKERRKEILANRKAITNNAETVAALLRSGVGNVEDVMGKLGDLSDEEKANLRAALTSGGGADEAVVANRKDISENEASLHELHLGVMSNKAKLYTIRAIIEGNRALILKNYAGAFIGNRQVANQNTDDIFKNRVAILDALKCEGQVQENFRNSKHNEATVDFLEHRSLMNNRVAQVNEKMSAANTKLIEINSAIMSSNAEIVEFNKKLITTNSNLLEGIKAETATPEANAARIAENARRIKVIMDRGARYQENVDQMMNKALENRAAIEANAVVINERRDQIHLNRFQLTENGKDVAQLLRDQGAE